MSEIFVDTIKNKAGSTSLDSDKLPNMYTGSAKMWANYRGTSTNEIRDSFNTSSVTDSGTGLYDFNFTNAMSNDDYASPSAAGNATGSFRCALVHDGDVVSTTSYRITTENSGSAAADSLYVHTQTSGDLA